MATAVNPLGAAGAASASGTVARTTIAENFDAFLRLLTTQLKNQNPLEPLDTNQFTQQLVQFSQVEQQMKTNEQLTTMATLQQATAATAAVQFIGQTVTFDGNLAKLSAGKATWGFTMTKAASVTFTVRDLNGQTVHTETRTLQAGAQTYQWNGRDAQGNQWGDGNYTLAVSAKDASGQNVGVSTEVEGVVDGLDVSQGAPMLLVGNRSFTMDKIKMVRTAAR